MESHRTYETFVDNGVEIPKRIRELTASQRRWWREAGDEAGRGGLSGISGEKPLLGHNILFDYGS